MFDLEDFTFAEMTQVGADLRRLGAEAQSMEEVANRIVQYLYDHFTSKETNQKACVLVRLFKTHPFGELDEGLHQFKSRSGIPGERPRDTRLSPCPAKKPFKTHP